MNATDLKVDVKIGSLREQVSAAQQEFDIAIKLHETWKPAAYDQDLHERMGDSFASQTFLVVRMALRREMLLALMRLWDRDSRAVRMKLSIADVSPRPIRRPRPRSWPPGQHWDRPSEARPKSTRNQGYRLGR